ncbi:SMODS-associated NUDIX domain-containing protein [Longispora urticae]
MLAVASLVWRHRGFWGLLRTTIWPFGTVRVSVAALLRIKTDDCYVLFHAPFRPQTYGPPGGVFKYSSPAQSDLDRLGFLDQRVEGRQAEMAHDLRGYLKAGRSLGFMRWFDSGKGRETAAECLRRELREELAEVGHPELVPLVDRLEFDLVRPVFESPRPASGEQYKVMRYFEVHEIRKDNTEALKVIDSLVELGRAQAETQVIAVSAADIRSGRHGHFIVSPQTAFLIGDRRTHGDQPALR